MVESGNSSPNRDNMDSIIKKISSLEKEIELLKKEIEELKLAREKEKTSTEKLQEEKENNDKNETNDKVKWGPLTVAQLENIEILSNAMSGTFKYGEPFSGDEKNLLVRFRKYTKLMDSIRSTEKWYSNIADHQEALRIVVMQSLSGTAHKFFVNSQAQRESWDTTMERFKTKFGNHNVIGHLLRKFSSLTFPSDELNKEDDLKETWEAMRELEKEINKLTADQVVISYFAANCSGTVATKVFENLPKNSTVEECIQAFEDFYFDINMEETTIQTIDTKPGTGAIPSMEESLEDLGTVNAAMQPSYRKQGRRFGNKRYKGKSWENNSYNSKRGNW